MKKAVLALVGLGVLTFGLLRYVKMQQDLLSKFQYRIISFKFSKFTLQELTVNITIKFISIADLEATVENIFLDVFVENEKVGYISNGKSFVIPARGSSFIDLALSFSPHMILKNVLNVFLSGTANKNVRFAVDGYARLKSGWVTTTLPVQYSSTLNELAGQQTK